MLSASGVGLKVLGFSCLLCIQGFSYVICWEENPRSHYIIPRAPPLALGPPSGLQSVPSGTSPAPFSRTLLGQVTAPRASIPEVFFPAKGRSKKENEEPIGVSITAASQRHAAWSSDA